MNKILVIVGPTSSGKSELAVKLAKLFNGEIISCDSRQIYKGMDLGTGKIAGAWSITLSRGREKVLYVYKNVIHHLIDFVNPKKQYSVSLFQKQAQKKIREIIKRGHLPILCGGTGHWIDAVVYNQQLPEVKPNLKLRSRLEKKSAYELYRQLQKLDSTRAKTIDRFNKRRLIRAIEIVVSTGKPVPKISNHKSEILNPLWLGINSPQDVLFARIKKRLKQRLKAGMIKEIQKLHRLGLPWKRLMDFGLEYRFGALYLQKKITYEEMAKQMFLANKHYAKRQMTWWKRNQDINWIKSPDQAAKQIKKFLLA
jgi:tRNA dimethylallyltransferase